MSKNLADDISSMAGAQEIQNNETLCYSFQKKKVHWVHSGRRKLGNEALKILLCFSATVPYDAEFSAKLWGWLQPQYNDAAS